jgi:hypothetical protein
LATPGQTDIKVTAHITINRSRGAEVAAGDATDVKGTASTDAAGGVDQRKVLTSSTLKHRRPQSRIATDGPADGDEQALERRLTWIMEPKNSGPGHVRNRLAQRSNHQATSAASDEKPKPLSITSRFFRRKLGEVRGVDPRRRANSNAERN